MNVLVYSGEGASTTCINHTIYTLKQFLSDNYDIIKVDDKILTTQYWEDTTNLVVFLGRKDLPYVNKLGSEDMERIRKYVDENKIKELKLPGSIILDNEILTSTQIILKNKFKGFFFFLI